MIFMVGK